MLSVIMLSVIILSVVAPTLANLLQNVKGLSSSNYEFVELIIRLIGGGLAPSSQTEGSFAG